MPLKLNALIVNIRDIMLPGVFKKMQKTNIRLSNFYANN